MYNSLYVLAVLCLLVVLSELLVRHTWAKHLGTALVVILLTAIVANLGILPAGSSEEQPVPIYEGVFRYLAPIAIFYLLLPVNLRALRNVGLPLMVLFLIGSIGTTLGVLLGMWTIGGEATLGDNFAAIGGMFVGTYTGGSINFNAVALHYDIVRDGVAYAGSIAVDNIITTLWMVASLALPRLLAPLWPKPKNTSKGGEASLGIEEDTETMHPIDLGITLALGLGALWLTDLSVDYFATLGWKVPGILIITVFALGIAQLPIAQKIRGAQALGMFSVYLFLAVIGAFCDFASLASLGSWGLYLLVFAFMVVLVHGLLIFGMARILRYDLTLAAVASQANVGGGTTALALARSFGRTDLVLPAVLLGSLGNALGTFLGFWAAGVLLPWLA